MEAVIHNYYRTLVNCYCFKELEGCEEALNSDLVQQDIQPDLTLKCIQYRSKASYHCLARRVLFLSRLILREMRRVLRETSHVSALEVPILCICWYSKLFCILRPLYRIDYRGRHASHSHQRCGCTMCVL